MNNTFMKSLIALFTLLCLLACNQKAAVLGNAPDRQQERERNNNPDPEPEDRRDPPNNEPESQPDPDPEPEEDPNPEPQPDSEPEQVDPRDIDDDVDGFTENEGDCDDQNGLVAPDLEEECDGIDNNCDGEIDELEECTLDEDGDGFPKFLDCDDNDNRRFPGKEEVCDNIDNDCNGQVDDNLEFFTVYLDRDGDGFGDPEARQMVCDVALDSVDNADDCDDTNANINPEADEICNGEGVDENCDGVADEATIFFRDADGDGVGGDEFTESCETPDGHVAETGDCNDANADVSPRLMEVCDEIDNNCNGEIDEGVQTVFYADDDGDTYGNENETLSACSTPDGYVDRSGDCDDADDSVHPDAEEICGDGIDNDCVDGENPGQEWYLDTDGDTYGDDASLVIACEQPTSNDGTFVERGEDCDNADELIHPDAIDICGDGIDQDCSGSDLACEPDPLDVDDDGDGLTENDGDCDDTDANIHPDAEDVCEDGIDQDCDGDDLVCPDPEPEPEPGDPFIGEELILVADLDADGSNESLCVSMTMFVLDEHREAPAHIVANTIFDFVLSQDDVIERHPDSDYFCRDLSDHEGFMSFTLVSSLGRRGRTPDPRDQATWIWLQNQVVCSSDSEESQHFCTGEEGSFLFAVAIIEGQVYPDGDNAPPLPE